MKITVLLFEAGRTPQPRRIPNTLEAMQELVGGNIETLTLDSGRVLICNEEGRISKLPLNALVRTLRGRQSIYGDFFICRAQGDQFASLHNVQDMYGAMDFITWQYNRGRQPV